MDLKAYNQHNLDKQFREIRLDKEVCPYSVTEGNSQTGLLLLCKKEGGCTCPFVRAPVRPIVSSNEDSHH